MGKRTIVRIKQNVRIIQGFHYLGFTVANYGDVLVSVDKSSLEGLPGPKELHICMKVALVQGIEHYETFSNHVCQICEWFVGKILHNL